MIKIYLTKAKSKEPINKNIAQNFQNKSFYLQT